MKKYISLLLAAIVFPFLIQAQNFADAFRFSSYQIQGTARSGGMGNAFGALGGDFTSISINPAGLGIYRTGELVFTPTFNINNTEISFQNNKFTDNDPILNFSNIGIVGTHNPSNGSGLISINYGIGFNRLSDFNSNSFVNNQASSVSFLDGIVNYANSEALSMAYLEQDIGDLQYRDWQTKLAWDTYLIDPVLDNEGNEIDGQYVSILYENEEVAQNKSVSSNGNINEYVLSLGLNFQHQFYIGAMLGIHDISFSRYSSYEEILETDDSFQYDDEYSVSGVGYNLKIGAIYKPVNSVRLGLSFHSPTFYKISEESVLSMDSYLQTSYSSYGVNTYEYDFYTPLKAILSGALIFNKNGLLSIDAEYQDYSQMRFRKGGRGTDTFNDLNSVMDQVFNNVINIRIGGEYKLTDQFSLRGGYELYGNPYSNEMINETFLSDKPSVWSAGLGYTANKFFVNVAFRQSVFNYIQSNDQPNFSELDLIRRNNSVLLSLGFKL